MKLAWIDLETTGLDPADGEILEVAVKVTDRHLNELVTYHSLVDPNFDIDTLFESDCDSFVREMHQKSGLYDALKEAEKKSELNENVDFDLVQIFKEHKEDGLYLAGSSVHFDIRWLHHHWPQVMEQVHHRAVDVSSTRVQMASLTGEDWVYPKKHHRALADVDESIAEFKFLWGKFRMWLPLDHDIDLWELP